MMTFDYIKQWLLPLCLLLFSAGPSASPLNHHVPTHAADHGPDLPSVGSSAFDKIFSTTNAHGDVVYDVPFPIQSLMRHVGRGQSNFIHTLLPFSRSLQRPRDNSYNTLLNPRLVLVAKNSDTAIERAKLFIGYVKERDELEVISYNDEAGRFEYQLVKGYSTENPEVYYAKRGQCLSCHQGQAPIFSAADWADTTIGIMGDLLAARLLGAGMDASPPRAKAITEQLFGLLPSLDAAGNFDALVREANRLVLHERIWLHGCGEVDACRLGLLLHTLIPNSVITGHFYKISRKTLLASSLLDQHFFHSFLSSTDMGIRRAIKKYKAAGSHTPLVDTAYDNEAILSVIDNIYQLSERDSPTTPRIKLITKDRLVLRTLRAFSPLDLNTLIRQVKNIDRLLLTLYREGNPIFAKAAINKPLIMQTLLNRQHSHTAAPFGLWLNKKTPPKRLYSGPVFPIYHNKTLNIFARHCHACHGTGDIYPPQFMVGNERQVTDNIRHLKHKILDKLTNNLMPPSPNQRQQLLDSGERDELLDYLRQ